MYKFTTLGLYFLFMAAILIVCFKTFGQPQKQAKYRYFIRHNNPRLYYSAVDTLNMASSLVGKAMYRDQSDFWLGAAERNLTILYQGAVLDSALIK